jgi:hypothetical protein
MVKIIPTNLPLSRARQLSQSNDRQISGGEPTLVATEEIARNMVAGDVDETKTLLFARARHYQDKS